MKCKNKIFFKNKILIFFIMITPIIFSIFFSSLFTNYNNIHKIPIAIVDNDLSKTSIKIVENLKSNSSINIILLDSKKSKKYLKNNKIEAIFTIKSGFEQNLINSTYEKSIELAYLDKSSIGPTLGDIIASEIMMELGIYKAANAAVTNSKKYNLIESNIFDSTVNIAHKLLEKDQFEMINDITILNPSGALVTTDINKILSRNTTFGYTIIVFSFIILFSNSNIIESSNIQIIKRLITNGYKPFHFYFGNVLSIIYSGILILFVQIIIFIFTFNIYDISIILVIMFALLLHLLLLSNIVITLSSLLKTKLRYQSTITPLLFLFGLTGGAFWNIEFLAENFRWISYLSPIYWSLKVMNGTILRGFTEETITILLIYLVCVLIFTALSAAIYKNYIKQLSLSNK